MRWLNKEHGAGLVRSSVKRDYARGLSCHLVDDELPLLRQPVKTYGKGGPWDVHVLNADYAVQSTEVNWRERRPLEFAIFKAHDDAPQGGEP